MLDLKPLVDAIVKEYALPRDGTHGIAHWARVMENGLRLTEHTKVNPDLVQLFALFHDSRRINESVDPGHGRRGAELAAAFRGKLFTLSGREFDLLYEACVRHTDGETDGDVVLQTCWDADRLDLGRVGIRPDQIRLCTDAARRPEILDWADNQASSRVVPEIVEADWEVCKSAVPISCAPRSEAGRDDE
jgi:uncharacterized protein